MAKRRGDEKSNDFSMEDAEAFIQQANEAEFGPGPGEFTSKHTFVSIDLASKLRAIDWFAHCGEPRDFNLTMSVERVKTWPQAIERMKSRIWENATLEARNQLTAYLWEHHSERYQDWNKITVKFDRKVVKPLTAKVWEPFRSERDLDVVFVHSLEWNILAALMEEAYMDCNHGSFFFHELLMVYEAGHLPCGWVGNWPQGSLVVF